VIPNLVSYLTTDIAWSCRFPFVTSPGHRELASWIAWPTDYWTGNFPAGERAIGLTVATVICWLWCAWFYRAARSSWRWLQRRTPWPWSDRELWLSGVSCALICGIAPASRMWMANVRFLEDICGGVTLGALGAGFWLMTRSGSRAARQLASTTYALLALYTVIVGVCLSFTGHTDNFEKQNPELFKHMRDQLSLCAS
jgi:hypothetical protein